MECLTNDGRNVEVIGPTTTRRFEADEEHLGDLIEKFQVDYVINGRTSARSPDNFLGEIIRARDGAHIWVRQIEYATDPEVVAKAMSQGLFNSLPDPSR